MKTEQDIQREIIAWLKLRPDVCVWRQSAGRRGHVSFGKVGQADISGIIQGGRRLELEVKTRKGKPSPAQVAFGEMIESFGGVYRIVRSLDEAIEVYGEVTG